MISASVLQAATDSRLDPHRLRVLILLHTHLTDDEFRPVKLFWLSQRLERDPASVSRSLKLLTELGYIKRGGGRKKRGDRGLRTVQYYRLSAPFPGDTVARRAIGVRP